MKLIDDQGREFEFGKIQVVEATPNMVIVLTLDQEDVHEAQIEACGYLLDQLFPNNKSVVLPKGASLSAVVKAAEV